MRNAALFITTAMALNAPDASLANPDRISFLLGSHHVNATRDFQEFNPGVFLTWERRLNYSVGLYQNSYEEISALGSIGYGIEITNDLNLGAFFAVAYYPGDGDEFKYAAGDLVPLIGLQARYKNAFVQLIPSDGESLDALLTFGLTFELN